MLTTKDNRTEVAHQRRDQKRGEVGVGFTKIPKEAVSRLLDQPRGDGLPATRAALALLWAAHHVQKRRNTELEVPRGRLLQALTGLGRRAAKAGNALLCDTGLASPTIDRHGNPFHLLKPASDPNDFLSVPDGEVPRGAWRAIATYIAAKVTDDDGSGRYAQEVVRRLGVRNRDAATAMGLAAGLTKKERPTAENGHAISGKCTPALPENVHPTPKMSARAGGKCAPGNVHPIKGDSTEEKEREDSPLPPKGGPTTALADWRESDDVRLAAINRPDLGDPEEGDYEKFLLDLAAFKIALPRLACRHGHMQVREIAHVVQAVSIAPVSPDEAVDAVMWRMAERYHDLGDRLDSLAPVAVDLVERARAGECPESIDDLVSQARGLMTALDMYGHAYDVVGLLSGRGLTALSQRLGCWPLEDILRVVHSMPANEFIDDWKYLEPVGFRVLFTNPAAGAAALRELERDLHAEPELLPKLVFDQAHQRDAANVATPSP